MFGGRVTLSKEDYGTLTDLAKKQIAAENRVSELTVEIAKPKKENEEAAERNATPEQKAQQIYLLKEKLQKAENELGSMKAKYQKLQEFMRVRWVKR